MVLRIRDWNTIFESAESRKLKTLRWVSIPNKTSGQGYTALIDNPDGPMHYAAWIAIVIVCSQREPREKRGILPEADGTLGGISRALGRISRLPPDIFAAALPRLLSDPEISWIEQVVDSSGKSPEMPGKSPEMPGESSPYIGGKGRGGKGREGDKRTEPACVTMARLSAFLAPWPRVSKPDQAATAWLSYIEGPEEEAAAFAARDRYLASHEVATGAVMEPSKWLIEQKSANWCGKWPIAAGKRKGPVSLRPEDLPRSTAAEDRAALQWLAENDPDPEAREDAKRRLA